ncbi:MAG: hypothetical protein ABSG25_01930, partial [Bryobacteraceae bacterium]
MKFKIAYLLLSGVSCMLGIYYIAEDAARMPSEGWFVGVGMIVGFAFLQIGLLNVLNALYGSFAVGVR